MADISKIKLPGIAEELNIEDTTARELAVNAVTASIGYTDQEIEKIKLPSQSGQNGKFLTTNGTSASWGDVLPSQANAGDAMIYDGTVWTKQSGYGYSSIGEYKTIINNKTIDDWEDYGPYCASESLIDSELANMIVGNTYKIDWNDTIYNCTAFIDEELEGCVLLGNLHIINPEAENTNEPFLLISIEGTLGCYATSTNTVVLSVEGVINEVVKIDAKYLPSSVDIEEFYDHTDNTDIHVTTSEKSTWNNKQEELVSGTNIKTINNSSLLGSGNIDIDYIIPFERTVDTSELLAKISAKLPVYCERDNILYLLSSYSATEFIFTATTELGNETCKYNSNLQQWEHISNRYVTTLTSHVTNTAIHLPAVTSADAGAFLRVNASGVWAKATVPNAEDNTF